MHLGELLHVMNTTVCDSGCLPLTCCIQCPLLMIYFKELAIDSLHTVPGIYLIYFKELAIDLLHIVPDIDDIFRAYH